MSFYDFPEHLIEQARIGGEHYWNDAGVSILISDLDLNSDSLVIDVGGYKGNFTHNIIKKHNCNVIVFEPVIKFYNEIRERFKDSLKVTAIPSGLSNKDEKVRIAGMNESSSTFYPSDVDAEEVLLLDVSKMTYTDIDLLALNGEGCEFPVLERLIQTDMIQQFRNVLIQFHIFVPHAEHRRNEIRKALKRTHKEQFCYNWTWELWSRK